MKRNFNEWFSNFRQSINGYDFYDIPALYTPLKNKLEKYIDEKSNQIKYSLIDS